MIKFKVGFTITSEMLFKLASQFLPIDDLSVEEIIEKSKTVDEVFLSGAPIKVIAPKKKQQVTKKFKHPDGRSTMDFVMEYLSKLPDKKAKWVAIRKYIENQGFSKSSVNNGISRLIKINKIKRIAPGIYQIISHEK